MAAKPVRRQSRSKYTDPFRLPVTLSTVRMRLADSSTKIFGKALTSCLCFLFSLWAPIALGQAGALDPTFSPALDREVNVVVLQPDGKILIGGAFRQVNNVERNFIARLNVDGTLDAQFNPGARDDAVVAMVLQRDGKIIIGGGPSRLARLHPDVSLDTSFAPEVSWVRLLGLQSDGKLLVVNDTKLSRLHPNGARDTSFVDLAFLQEIPSDAGMLSVPIYLDVVAPLNDGKTLIGGNIMGIGGVVLGGGLTRLNADGTLDQTFHSFTN